MLNNEISGQAQEAKEKGKAASDIGERVEKLAAYVEADPQSVDTASVLQTAKNIVADLEEEAEAAEDSLDDARIKAFFSPIVSVALLGLSVLPYLWAKNSIANSTVAFFSRFIVDGQLDFDALRVAELSGEVTSAQVSIIMEYSTLVSGNWGEWFMGQLMYMDYLDKVIPTTFLEWAGLNAPMFAVGITIMLGIAAGTYYGVHWRARRVLKGHRARLQTITAKVQAAAHPEQLETIYLGPTQEIGYVNEIADADFNPIVGLEGVDTELNVATARISDNSQQDATAPLLPQTSEETTKNKLSE
jgi:hypothetical protein